MIERGFEEPSERVKQLKSMLMNATPWVEADRAVLVTKSYQETEDQPMVIRRAKALEKVLLNLPVAIRDGELIVGAMTKQPRSVQIYPEFSCEWVEKEFATMSTRSADPFNILPETVAELKEAFAYWRGKTISDLALAYMSDEAKQCIDDGVYAVGNYLYGGIGHINVDYGRILKRGCKGIIEDASAAMVGLDPADPDYRKKVQYYKATVIVYRSVIRFANRYAQEAERLAIMESNPMRRQELFQISTNCRKVPENGAENFYEACQSFWFTHMIIQLESNGHSVSPGRFDQYMYPYYKMEMVPDPNQIQELIDCLWIKFNDINKIRDEVYAQAFAGYQAFQNLCVGGQNAEGFDASNELSYHCMDAAGRVKMPSPSFSIRVWQNTPDEFLLRACEVVRLGLGVPAMYNDEVIVPALVNRGVSLKDARNYCLIGCVEPSIPGKTEGWHDSAFFNIARVLEITLNSGKAGIRQLGPVTKDILKMESMEELYEAYCTQMEYFVNKLSEANNSTDYAHTERGQLPYLSALVDDCIAAGRTLQDGGAIYNFTGPQAVGVADAGDSMYAIQKNVFEDGKISMEQLKTALASNFGHACQNTCKKAAAEPVVNTSGLNQMTEQQLYDAIKKVLSESPSIDLSELHAQLTAADNSDHAANHATGNAVGISAGSEDMEIIRKILDRTPGFGNDIDEVDLAARRCGKIYCTEVEKYRNPRNGIFHAGMYPVSSNVLFGKDVGALPDGRLAGRPLADGVSPRAGKDNAGPTAAANSVAKLDHFAASNGTLYNQKFLPSALAGDQGLKNFSNVIRSYFDRKGMHVQFNVVDRETLYAAQKDPQSYKDLIVRVAGYSAQFIVLDKEVQDDIINRTEHGM